MLISSHLPHKNTMNCNPNVPENIALSDHLAQIEEAISYNLAHISALRKFLAAQGFERLETKLPAPKLEMWNLTGKLLSSGYTHVLISTHYVTFNHSYYREKTFIDFHGKTPQETCEEVYKVVRSFIDKLYLKSLKK